MKTKKKENAHKKHTMNLIPIFVCAKTWIRLAEKQIDIFSSVSKSWKIILKSRFFGENFVHAILLQWSTHVKAGQ